ncbi:MAG: cytochrome c oxidase subunit II [Actinobacteria bacterium]|nr:cytochrome c oxidase subunit II [Actinomycetota bacterium]
MILAGSPSVLLAGSPSMLDPHGTEASRLAGVWWLAFGMAVVVYMVVAGFILRGVLRGRRSEQGRSSRISEGAFIWIGGIIVPSLILLVLAVVTVQATTHLRRADKNPLSVEVVGKRWWWEVRYPSLGVTTANEIHIPVGQPIDLGLDSADVIHSFWVPQLAGKLDNIPGQHNVLRMKATTAGVYRGQCAEFCGVQHAKMGVLVIAESPATFARWASQHQHAPSPPDGDETARGQLVFMSSPCAGCHTIKGTQADGTRGPDLTDVGSRLWLGAVTVHNTRNNLEAWITDPQLVKPGVLMPPTPLPPDQLRALVAYLESLR